MIAHKAAAIAVVTVTAIFSFSCAKPPAESVAEYDTVSIYDESSLSQMPDFYADLEDEALENNTSVGRIALAMLICKLDGTNDYHDLLEESSIDLFEALKEEAASQNITLEKLDSTYYLGDILKSEQIYVSFSSNNVTDVTGKSAGSEEEVNWQDKFQKAIGMPINKKTEG